MKLQLLQHAAITALLLTEEALAALKSPKGHRKERAAPMRKKQLQHLAPRQDFPKNATGVQSITSPSGVTIRYKEPGKAGVCETTPGVNS